MSNDKNSLSLFFFLPQLFCDSLSFQRSNVKAVSRSRKYEESNNSDITIADLGEGVSVGDRVRGYSLGDYF